MDHLTPPPQPPNQTALIPQGQRAMYVASPYGLESSPDPDAEVGLFEYWNIIRRNSRTILAASVLGLVIGFCVGIPMKPVYRATTTIEILAINQDFMNMRDTNPVNNSNDSDVSEEATQAQLLASATLIKRVAARLGPDGAQAHTPDRAAPSVPAWETLLHFGHSTPVNARAAAVGKAAGTLKVKTNPRTRIIEATVDSADPQLAAEFLNTLSREFIQQNQESRLLTTEHTGDWLSHELRDARDKLRNAEDALQQYARNSGIVYMNDSTNVATERLQQYQQSLSAATAERIAKQSRYELAQNSAPETLADVLNDGSLRETQSKMNDLKRQIADLTTVYSPEYSKVRRLQAEMQSLQSDFDLQRTEILSRIKTDFQEADRKERLLAGAYNTQTAEVTGQGEKGIQYNILKRDVDSNRQLYDTMLQQMKQAAIATAMRASNVRVVDQADVPGLPISPNFKLNAAIGMIGGLILSTFIVLVRDQMDHTLQLPGDIKQWAELPELGVIPNAGIAASKSYGTYYRHLDAPNHTRRRGTSPMLNLPDTSSGNSIELSAWQKSPTLLAESFRSALTSILFIGEGGSRPRVLVFTSANPGEGKTTAVSNLAIAAAEIRLKVLVIDADLRRPRMHHLFDLPNASGLTGHLQDEMPETDLQSLIQPTTIPNLHVITAGIETQAAAHLLYSPNFATLIHRLRAQYDMILIDTPPMLQMTDARIIGRQADAVVLIARAGQTTRDSLRAAKERFDEDRIPVLGSMLNDWNPRHGDGKYGTYYSRYKN